MKFSDFTLGFREGEAGERLNWPRGHVTVSGNADPLCRRELEENFAFGVEIAFRDDPALEQEAYRLEITPAGAVLAASSRRGFLYAVQTLRRFGEVEDKCACVISDAPLVPERGLKLYLPPPDETAMAEFFRILELALRYKYNFVMLELGGAMEYLSHPEINEAYVKYASFMNEYPGKAMKIQNAFSWRKNSIHTDNGGGKVLTQVQLKKIVDFCRERELELLPEVPSLSHCDYLLAAHPELAERREDPYPDTACPSNPEYRKLFFDILDETVAFFRPRRINIGHDEYYSIGLCPQCRTKSAPRLYADDITAAADHLRKQGVVTCIWGEKLLDSHFLSGRPCGGAEIPRNEEGLDPVPATWPAMELIPDDVEIFHWYWSIDRKLDCEFDRRNRPYLFGNFGPAELPGWEGRRSRKNFRGVCVSNWGRSDYETMRRNGILFDLVCASYLCWDPALGSEDYPALYRGARAELEELGLRRRSGGFPLCVTHTAETGIGFKYFFDGNFIKEEDYLLGHHIFVTKEGKELSFPVVFGKNISNAVNPPERKCDPFSEFDRYILNRQHIEILGGARPERGPDGRFRYRTWYVSPVPAEELTYREFRPSGRFDCKVEIEL